MEELSLSVWTVGTSVRNFLSYSQGRRDQPTEHGAVLRHMGLVYVRKVAEHTRRSKPEEASQ